MCPLPVPRGCADSERLKFTDPHEPPREDLLGAGFRYYLILSTGAMILLSGSQAQEAVMLCPRPAGGHQDSNPSLLAL